MTEFFSFEIEKWQLLFWIFVGISILEIFNIAFFYLKFAFYKEQETENNYPPVSVIIATRNNALYLKNFLPLILEQDYPDYEVIVMDHGSTDETSVILKSLQNKYKHLIVRYVPWHPASPHKKKFVLTLGIKAAKNEFLLFTDADCKPASNQWIKLMVSKFDQNTDFVLGYGAYEKEKGLKDKLVRSETVLIAMQYFGYALRGLPYMGVGRNLAWRKSLFDKVGGFQDHIYEPSGSDDIFVNHYANSENTKVVLNPKSFTYSVQPKSIKHWILQKQRHFGSFKYYRFKYKFLLTLFSLSKVGFWGLTGAFLALKFLNFWIIFIFFVREFLMLLSLFKAVRRLKEKSLFLFIAIYEIFQPIIHFLIYLFKRNKKTEWQ